MYSVQLETENQYGKHNITEWVLEEISSIKQSDIEKALERANVFLTKERDDLETTARINQIHRKFGEVSPKLIVNSLLKAIILIKPEILIRGGKEVLFHGVSPVQAVATMIGLELHSNILDAVQTGINVLADFSDMGIYNVFITKEADRLENQGTYIEVHGDSAVVVPTMHISLELYKRINATRYLPPMLVEPLPIERKQKC